MDNAQFKKVLIVGISSDIGVALAKLYLAAGYEVCGTYRKNIMIEGLPQENLIFLDVSERVPESAFTAFLGKQQFFDQIIFSIGVLDPINSFFDTEFEAWEKSFEVNSVRQIELMHIIRPYLVDSAMVTFFNGGAPNGVLPLYSAYSLGKITLAKMVEYLDAEDDKIKYIIVGTGWVNTKIHRQTVDAHEKAGVNLQRTKAFMENPKKGTEISDIYSCIQWAFLQDKAAVSGRNFSVVWDSWRDPKGSAALVDELKSDGDMYKLRRYKNELKVEV